MASLPSYLEVSPPLFTLVPIHEQPRPLCAGITMRHYTTNNIVKHDKQFLAVGSAGTSALRETWSGRSDEDS